MAKLKFKINFDEFNAIFIVMELESLDLNKLLMSKAFRSLTEEHVVIIMYNLLCILNQIHQTNVIHRDIKSSNILIYDKCNLKICDFGLARCIPKQSKSNEL